MAPEGATKEVQLLADTGCPFALIVDANIMATFKHGDGLDAKTNFGPLTAGQFKIAIPDLNFAEQLLGYASDAVSSAVKSSSDDFNGLVGLPLLRMLEYGGDSDSFWIRAKA